MQITHNQTTFPDYTVKPLTATSILEKEADYITFTANGKTYQITPDKSGFTYPGGSPRPMNLFQNICQDKFPYVEFFEQINHDPDFYEQCKMNLTETDYFNFINSRESRWEEI